MTRSVAYASLFLVVCLVAAASTRCSRDSKLNARANGAPVRVEEAGDLNLVTVAHPEQFPLVTVEMRKMREELRVNGVVAPDVNRTVPVNSLSSGRVLDIRVRLGDFVKKGELLLTLHSSDVTMAFADFQKFRADELLARKSLERAQLLYSKGAIAQKDLQAAEEAEEKAKVDVQTALERVKILGGDPDHPSPMIEMRAPISGTVIEQNTTRGAGVKSLDNSPNLFTIADLSRVWILCDVYENSLTQVHLGDFGEVRLNAYPERVMKARVANIGRILDPATRTVKVRFELDNYGSLMRPGMFATVTFLSQSAQIRAVVPATVVMRLHDQDWVFAPLGGNRFRRTEIQVGATTSDGFQEILSGVKAGDQVVANALQFSSSVEQQ